MADHLYRTRLSAPNSRLLWLMAALSLLLHLLLLSLAGLPSGASAPAPESAPQISIRLQSTPAPAPPDITRVAENDHQGAGNTAEAGHLLSRSAMPARAAEAQAAPPPPSAPAAKPAPIVKPETAPAKLTAAPAASARPPSAGSLLAQVGELARSGGDNAVADSDLESGQAGADIGAAARGYPWARYQADWRLKVERIGNLNYPAEARRLGLHGAVTLEVTIGADGSLQAQRVTRSSGSPVLDEAARRIVELASPFPPFPAALSRGPALRISQRFVFTRDNLLSSH
ncbi:energy transducer TonB [Chromobacterium subtsugae]|uniref:energy transducer TonB n=1 Tax=Chromobacterium subtsugae TaxID=251747 RepID=UPI0006411B29|nr:energy transducer TonB [Chromobacterium subtsugae]